MNFLLKIIRDIVKTISNFIYYIFSLNNLQKVSLINIILFLVVIYILINIVIVFLAEDIISFFSLKDRNPYLYGILKDKANNKRYYILGFILILFVLSLIIIAINCLFFTLR